MGNLHKEFLELQKKWYKKLEKSGFEDIEQEDGNLKHWTSFRSPGRRSELTYFQGKEEYYRLAGQFYHEYNFDSDIDRVIWSMHMEGVSARDISKALKKKRIRREKTFVNDCIRRLTRQMLIFYGVKNG